MQMFQMLDRYLSCSMLTANKERRLVASDRADLFQLIKRLQKVLIDMTTGPCLLNQTLVYKQATDCWLGILLRIIDDLDSTFYKLKETVLDFLLSLVEGNDPAILQYFASNFDVPVFYNHVVILIKKLWIGDMKRLRVSKNL